MTKCQWDIRPINLQIENLNSQNCAGHNGRKRIDKNLSDSFIFRLPKIKKLYPHSQSSWGIKVGMRPIVSCKKEWFMVLPNWSFCNNLSKRTKVTLIVRNSVVFAHLVLGIVFPTFSFPDLSWAAEHQFNFQKTNLCLSGAWHIDEWFLIVYRLTKEARRIRIK